MYLYFSCFSFSSSLDWRVQRRRGLGGCGPAPGSRRSLLVPPLGPAARPPWARPGSAASLGSPRCSLLHSTQLTASCVWESCKCFTIPRSACSSQHTVCSQSPRLPAARPASAAAHGAGTVRGCWGSCPDSPECSWAPASCSSDCACWCKPCFDQ